MGEWPTTGPDPSSGTPMDEIAEVRDQLWTAFRAPAMAYREHAPAPRSRRAQLWATVYRLARIPVLAAVYLGVVVGLSLAVARVVHAPATGPSAATTGHNQQHNGFTPHRSAQHHRPAQHKRPSRPVGTNSPSPALSAAGPSPVSSQPPPTQPASSSSPPSPSPTPTLPSPTPTLPSPTPTPTLPLPTPTLPSPT